MAKILHAPPQSDKTVSMSIRWDERRQKWRTSVLRHDGVKVDLGLWKSPDRAYEAAQRQVFEE